MIGSAIFPLLTVMPFVGESIMSGDDATRVYYPNDISIGSAIFALLKVAPFDHQHHKPLVL